MRWAIPCFAAYWTGFVLAALVLNACGPADGQGVGHVERPPARYVQAEQSAFCHFLPWDRLAEVCGPGNYACGEVNGAQIWLPHPSLFPRDQYAALPLHELGHNSGWTAAHER